MNNGLKIEENQEKERLLKSGLTNWTKVEFNLFVQACERFGRNDLEKIAEHVGKTKTLDDIKKYSEKFWERVADIQEGPRIVKLIERGEKNLIERANNIQLVKH